jgi:hypothetical protein
MILTFDKGHRISESLATLSPDLTPLIQKTPSENELISAFTLPSVNEPDIL